MNMKKTVLSILGVMILSFGVDFVIHGVLMTELYTSTANLWRTMDEMGPLQSAANDLIFAVLFVLFYLFVTTHKTCKNGIQFGLWYGLISGFTMMSMMNYMPIPGTIAISWFFASFVKSVLLGALVGYVTKDSKRESDVMNHLRV